MSGGTLSYANMPAGTWVSTLCNGWQRIGTYLNACSGGFIGWLAAPNICVGGDTNAAAC